MLLIRESGKISLGIPNRLHTGAKNEEAAESAPEADKSSIAVTSAINDGRILTVQFRPLILPMAKWDHTLTLFMQATKRIITINNGIE